MPPPPPMIIGEQALFRRKTNKKRKTCGTSRSHGDDDSTAALDPASATNSANYKVDSVMTKRVKKKTVQILKPITNFTVSYINDAATIVFAGKEAFKTGGQVRVLGGVTSADGVAVAGIAEFTISKGGKLHHAVVIVTLEMVISRPQSGG